jgi:hypothetical protein
MPTRHTQPLNVRQKTYRMRGYGGDPATTTHVHPRQQAMGKRIVLIPGVGYRHVKVTASDKEIADERLRAKGIEPSDLQVKPGEAVGLVVVLILALGVIALLVRGVEALVHLF